MTFIMAIFFESITRPPHRLLIHGSIASPSPPGSNPARRPSAGSPRGRREGGCLATPRASRRSPGRCPACAPRLPSPRRATCCTGSSPAPPPSKELSEGFPAASSSSFLSSSLSSFFSEPQSSTWASEAHLVLIPFFLSITFSFPCCYL